MKVVTKLCEPYYMTRRCITADNFFTSIGLCFHLWEKGLEFIGTIRSNKLEIPLSFLKNKLRTVGSSMFAFKDFLTLVSFVPKSNKAVVLVSTGHHEAKIDTLTKKPQIIMDYNKLKGDSYGLKSINLLFKNISGGVDTFDHLVALNSCRRKTNRWPFNVLMFMIDSGAQNVFSLFKLQNKQKIDLLRGLKSNLFILFMINNKPNFFKIT